MRVLVSPQNPLKSAGDYAPLEERIAATREMMRGLPNVRVEPEAAEGPTFAVDSIAKRVLREPHTDFIYVMGADSFAGLHRWRRWQALMEMVPIAVVSRPGFRLEALQSPAARAFAKAQVPERLALTLHRRTAPAWCFLTGLDREESSTAIRAREDPSKFGMESAT
ncbi:hypothetical protein GCM10007148_26780 [Parvularcula lutaonensis]|nr:hypothetical protein GCM10007148_26780 [Parvularcula lutaonensis]